MWRADYDLVHTTTLLMGVYSSKTKASRIVEISNKENTRPVVEDDYGPLDGSRFYYDVQVIEE